MSEATQISIDDLLAETDELFSLPDIYVRLNQLLNDPTASAADISDLLAHDPALTAKVLKLANSAAYHLPAQVDNIARAITVIGTQELRNLVLSASVADAFKGVSAAELNMDDFWRRSVYCGLLARQIGEYNRYAHTERLFICGLLSHIGWLVLLQKEPELLQQLLQQVPSGSPFSLSLNDQQLLGFSTAELAAALLHRWGLPQSIIEPVQQYRQQQQLLVQQDLVEGLILHVATLFSERLDSANNFHDSYEDFGDMLLSDTQSKLGLTHDSTSQLLHAVDAHVLDVIRLIMPSHAQVS